MLAFCAGGLVECRAKPSGQFQRIVIGPEVEEEQPRLLVQHVAVHGGYVDAVCTQCSDHRIHLVTGEDEISGDGGLAAPVG